MYKINLFSVQKVIENSQNLCRFMQIIHKTDNYIVGSFPNKRFSGYQLLSFYYVSLALAVPEHVVELGLDYKEEYGMALKLATS